MYAQALLKGIGGRDLASPSSCIMPMKRPGLQNSHNTCYMNASLQSLGSLRPIWQLSKELSWASGQHSFLGRTIELFHRMDACVEPTVSADWHVANLTMMNRRFTRGNHEDAASYTESLLWSLSTDALRMELTVEDAFLPSQLDIFSRIVTTPILNEVSCPCGHISPTIQPRSYNIHITARDSRTVEEALLDSLTGKLDDYSCMNCKNTGGQTCNRKLLQAPPILILQLNQFSQDGSGKYSKSKFRIKFEEELELKAEHVALHDGVEGNIFYDLTSVVVHAGDSLEKGHFFSYDRIGEHWSLRNDEIVRPAKFQETQNSLHYPYLLFYTRRGGWTDTERADITSCNMKGYEKEIKAKTKETQHTTRNTRNFGECKHHLMNCGKCRNKRQERKKIQDAKKLKAEIQRQEQANASKEMEDQDGFQEVRPKKRAKKGKKGARKAKKEATKDPPVDLSMYKNRFDVLQQHETNLMAEAVGAASNLNDGMLQFKEEDVKFLMERIIQPQIQRAYWPILDTEDCPQNLRHLIQYSKRLVSKRITQLRHEASMNAPTEVAEDANDEQQEAKKASRRKPSQVQKENSFKQKEMELFTIANLGLRKCVSQREPSFAETISSVADDLSQLEFESGQLASLYISQLLRTGKQLPVLNKQFHKNCMRTVAKTRTKVDLDLENFYTMVYAPLRPDVLQKIDISELGTVLPLLATRRVTAFEQDIVRNFENRLHKTSRILVDSWIQGTEKLGVVNAIASAITEAVLSQTEFCIPRIQVECQETLAVEVPRAIRYCKDQISRFGDLLPLNEDKLEKGWQKYLPWESHMLGIISIAKGFKQADKLSDIDSLSRIPTPEKTESVPQLQNPKKAAKVLPPEEEEERRKRRREKRKRQRAAAKEKARIKREEEKAKEMASKEERNKHPKKLRKRLKLKNKAFSIVPSARMGPKFMPISTNVLLALVWIHNQKHSKKVVLPAEHADLLPSTGGLLDADKRAIWNACFKFDHLETVKTELWEGHTFDCFAQCDGCTLNLLFRRRKKNRPSMKNNKDLRRSVEEDWLSMEEEELLTSHISCTSKCPLDSGKNMAEGVQCRTSFVAIDPGTAAPLSVVELGDSRESPRTRQFTRGRYLQFSGRTENKAWHARQRERHPELQLALSHKPSHKTWDATSAVHYALHLWHAHAGLYCQYKFKSKARKLKIQKARLLVAMYKWLMRGRPPEDVVLFFGAGARGWHKSAISRNLAPLNRLERLMNRDPRIRFLSINEYRTSQSCPCKTAFGVCRSQLRPARVTDSTGAVLHPLDKAARGEFVRRPHALKICPSCLTVWNRDYAAARQILRAGIHLVLGLDRPDDLRPRQFRDFTTGDSPRPVLIHELGGLIGCTV